jgi:hypothetical protein
MLAVEAAMRAYAPRPPAVRGHGDQQPGAGCCDASQLAHRGKIVVEMLEHVGDEDQIERAVVERERFEPALGGAGETPLTAEVDRVGGEIHAGRGAQTAILDQVVSRAAAGVEHADALRGPGLAQQRPDDRAPPGEPPVSVLELELLAIGLLFQAGDSSRRSAPSRPVSKPEHLLSG